MSGQQQQFHRPVDPNSGLKNRKSQQQQQQGNQNSYQQFADSAGNVRLQNNYTGQTKYVPAHQLQQQGYGIAGGMSSFRSSSTWTASNWDHWSPMVMPTSYPEGDHYPGPQITPDEFTQWWRPAVQWLTYLCLMFGVSCFMSFVYAEAAATFPQIDPSIGNVLARSLFIGGGMFLIVLVAARYTGAINDMWQLMLALGVDVCFSKKWKYYPNPWAMRASTIGKLLFGLIGIVCGTFIGPLFVPAIHGGPVYTSDCAVTFSWLCFSLPKTLWIDKSHAQIKALIANLICVLAVWAAWAMLKKKSFWTVLAPGPRTLGFPGVDIGNENDTTNEDENIELDSQTSTETYTNPETGEVVTTTKLVTASSSAAMPPEPIERQVIMYDNWFELATCIGGTYGGIAFVTSTWLNFPMDMFYYVVISTYVNDRTEADVFVWPGLVACALVFIIALFFFGGVYFANKARKTYRREQEAALRQQV